MIQIGNYPDDYDLSLLNTIYHYPQRNSHGAIDLIIKDNVSGEKFLETIEDPEYDYYMINNDVHVDHNFFFIEKEKTTHITVPYRTLLKDIAERTDNMNFYIDNINNGNRFNNQRLHTVPRVMGSDSDIEDHFRWKFSNKYKNELGNISKAYFDIEVDGIKAKGDFPEPGECPINAISIIDDIENSVHTYLLRNPENPLIEQFEKRVGPDLYSKLKTFVIDSVGGWEKAASFKIDKLGYKFHFYDEKDELQMIKDLFDRINTLKPDFVLVWNMAFDMTYINARIRKLGANPEDIICHKDFKFKVAAYVIDERNMNDFAERNDFAKISSYSVYLDQLIQFASRRKGQSAIANYRLDYIGELVCGVKKLDYHHITNNINKLPYLDYETFVFYNIIDTIVQYCIEQKVNDIGNVFNNVLLNNTRYTKIYRQTIYLKNRAIKSFYNSGFIMGNNVNKDNTKTKFPGAFVSDPRMNSDYSKKRINNKPVSIYDNLNDFDYKALYPSITSESNMAPNTIIAHITIPELVYEFENRFKRDSVKYKREGQFLEDLQSHVWLEFFHRWFHMASYEEMYDDVIEYFSREAHPAGKLGLHTPNGMVPGFIQIPYNVPKNAFIKIKSDDDISLYNGTKDISHPYYHFTDDIKNFKELYNSVQKVS